MQPAHAPQLLHVIVIMQHVVTVAVGIWFHSYFAAHVHCLFVIYAVDVKANSDMLSSGKCTCM